MWAVKVLSPKTCYIWMKKAQPWFMVLTLITFLLGLVFGLWWAPPDYQQGDSYRIMFIHVPAASMSLFIYLILSGAVVLYFVWRIKVFDMLAEALVPMGILFTGLTLITGVLWGKPTWGTYWIWDARLTSELILLIIYVGIYALRQSIPERTHAAKASGTMVLIGLINIPIIHYSVVWWHTLHQGVTLFAFQKPAIAPTMLFPLILMFGAYFFYTLWMLCLRIRYEIIHREANCRWLLSIKH